MRRKKQLPQLSKAYKFLTVGVLASSALTTQMGCNLGAQEDYGQELDLIKQQYGEEPIALFETREDARAFAAENGLAGQDTSIIAVQIQDSSKVAADGAGFNNANSASSNNDPATQSQSGSTYRSGYGNMFMTLWMYNMMFGRNTYNPGMRPTLYRTNNGLMRPSTNVANNKGFVTNYYSNGSYKPGGSKQPNSTRSTPSSVRTRVYQNVQSVNQRNAAITKHNKSVRAARANGRSSNGFRNSARSGRA